MKNKVRKDSDKKDARRYDISRTFEYNKEHGPFEKIKNKNAEIKKILGNYGISTNFFGYKTNLPIGVAAGTLHNLDYIKAAILDGFEVLTWKTFRSEHRLAHKSDGKHIGHNIVFLPTHKIAKDEIGTERVGSVATTDKPEQISITNSVGMPSPAPVCWMPDLEEGQVLANKHKKCIVTSVVGTAQKDDDIYAFARDYAFTARCAESTGESIIELNLSCPNVGKDGVIYKDIRAAKIIARTVRETLRNKDTVLLLKLGYEGKAFYKKFLKATNMYIDGVVAINTIPMEIVDENANQALPGGLSSGTCGAAIIDRSVEAVEHLVAARKELGLKKRDLKIIGCGGVTSAQNFMRHIDAGAEFVMCATASLFNPKLPIEIAQYIKANKINKKI